MRKIDLNLIRPRRNRSNTAIRDLVRENVVTLNDIVFPLFVAEGQGVKEVIASMPGIYRYSVDTLLTEIFDCVTLGIKAFALFPKVEDSLKNSQGTESVNTDGICLKAIRAIKSVFPDILLITDVALDPYSSDGHDGVVENGKILNDSTLVLLAEMAVAQAKAGADIVAPSDMMDGRVYAIRQALDVAGFYDVGIISYCVKYASAFYGPFRDALDSAPKSGDKKTYQMDFGNAKEALREANLDTEEGADVLMVKPGLPYLDLVKLLADNSHLPIAVYNVSGEYAMIKAAGQNGWVDTEMVMIETLTAFKRAGASIIFTYFAKDYALYLKRKS